MCNHIQEVQLDRSERDDCVSWVTIDTVPFPLADGEPAYGKTPCGKAPRADAETGKARCYPNSTLRCSRCGESFPAPAGSIEWVDGVTRAFMAAHAHCRPQPTFLERLDAELATCIDTPQLDAVLEGQKPRMTNYAEACAVRELYFRHRQRIGDLTDEELSILRGRGILRE